MSWFRLFLPIWMMWPYLSIIMLPLCRTHDIQLPILNLPNLFHESFCLVWVDFHLRIKIDKNTDTTVYLYQKSQFFCKKIYIHLFVFKHLKIYNSRLVVGCHELNTRHGKLFWFVIYFLPIWMMWPSLSIIMFPLCRSLIYNRKPRTL